MGRFSEPQLRGLQATARGEVILTHTGSRYTIIGPAGSKTLWGLMRAGFIAKGPKVPLQSQTPMVLTSSGHAALSSVERRARTQPQAGQTIAPASRTSP
jgi:hypothetical protein